jgi:5'-3' exonuclease
MAALCKYTRTIYADGISGLVQDYIVLCFFLGNDFLPQLPSLNIHTNAIPILLETYAESIGQHANAAFVQHGQLNWGCISLFLEVLAKKEPELLAAEIVVRGNMANALRTRIADGKITEDAAFKASFPLLYREAEENIRPGTARWKSRYYTAVFGDKIGRAKFAPKIARSYFKMLDWVFHYYTSGITCWMLTYEYIGAPLITDLNTYGPRTRSLPMCNVILRPMTPLAQLVYVLPRQMHYLLPPVVRKRLATPKYSYLYPTNPIFRGAFCQWTRSARAELPPIPDELLYL